MGAYANIVREVGGGPQVRMTIKDTGLVTSEGRNDAFLKTIHLDQKLEENNVDVKVDKDNIILKLIDLLPQNQFREVNIDNLETKTARTAFDDIVGPYADTVSVTVTKQKDIAGQIANIKKIRDMVDTFNKK